VRLLQLPPGSIFTFLGHPDSLAAGNALVAQHSPPQAGSGNYPPRVVDGAWIVLSHDRELNLTRAYPIARPGAGISFQNSLTVYPLEVCHGTAY
jgi:hypothetical protein